MTMIAEHEKKQHLARAEAVGMRDVISAPLIYGMIVPVAFLDLCFSIYQAICFPLHQIPRVDRTDFITIDRHHLRYLTPLERINCVYCGYANGVIAYVREIASRTEQYWCPIKHAHAPTGKHARYGHFLTYGAETERRSERDQLRHELQEESSSYPPRS